MLAWADREGGFSRWVGPVSKDFPDPVKSSIATKAGASTSVSRKTDMDLFGEDDLLKDAAMDGDVDLGMLDGDEEMLDPDKDWIIDDMDGAINDEPRPDVPRSNGYVKEMGKALSLFHVSASINHCVSEHHQGPAAFPTRIDAIPEQEAVPW